MTNQEAYEELCDKAEKYDKLVKAIEDIKAEIEAEKDGLYEGLDDAYLFSLGVIIKHTKELM